MARKRELIDYPCWVNSTTQYIAVLVHESGGGWSVLFPDLPGCATHGASVPEAIARAANAAAGWLAASRARGDEFPVPKSSEEVRGNDGWGRGHGINWSTAVISLVAVILAANDNSAELVE